MYVPSSINPLPWLLAHTQGEKQFLSPRVEHSYYVDLSVELQSYAHFGEEPGRRGQATPL